MGNRAIIKSESNNIGVYLHWNGDYTSVKSFLEYCKLKQYRDFDDPYGMARFCQVVGNFFGGGLSIGIETNINEYRIEDYCLDNGIYIVKGWDIIRIVGKCYNDKYDLNQLLKMIDNRQPSTEQLGDFLDAVETPSDEIKIGDIAFIANYNGGYDKYKVIGFGEDRVINGRNVLNVPYIQHYDSASDNINNYIFEKTRICRVKRE